jgi:hypothetical protein
VGRLTQLDKEALLALASRSGGIIETIGIGAILYNSTTGSGKKIEPKRLIRAGFIRIRPKAPDLASSTVTYELTQLGKDYAKGLP